MSKVLIVDSREPKKIIEICKESKIPFEVKALKTGDFAIGDVRIERKSIGDFVNCIQNKRFTEQCNRLFAFPIGYILISGSLTKLQKEFKRLQLQLNVNSIEGMIASLAVRYGFSIIWLPNDKMLVNVAYRMCKKLDEGKYLLPKIVIAKRARLKVSFLTNIRGVSPKIAEELLSTFKTIQGVANAEKDELLNVPGIGETVAKNIIKFFKKESSVI